MVAKYQTASSKGTSWDSSTRPWSLTIVTMDHHYQRSTDRYWVSAYRMSHLFPQESVGGPRKNESSGWYCLVSISARGPFTALTVLVV